MRQEKYQVHHWYTNLRAIEFREFFSGEVNLLKAAGVKHPEKYEVLMPVRKELQWMVYGVRFQYA